MATQRIAVIGAAGGIGGALCRRLHLRGDQLYLLGRSEDKLAELSGEVDGSYRQVDASELEPLEAALEAAKDELDGLDGVVNLAGSILLKPAHLTTLEEWQSTLRTNLTTAFATVRGATKVFGKQGGSIVLMSSAAAGTGLPNHEAIAAAKAGVEGLVRSAAASYCSRGIRVNAVAPGLVKTPLTRPVWSNERSREFSERMHALGRLGDPDDIASLIAWLLAEETQWVTGEVFAVDGGLSNVRNSQRS